jgi:hypothetical protein
MKIVVLSFCFISLSILNAAATPPSDDDSFATSGSGSEICDQNTLATVIHTPRDIATYLATAAHILPKSKFNTQFVNKMYLEDEPCSMLAIADDTIGQLSQRMYEKVDAMQAGTSVWSEMRQILKDLAIPAAHAAILLANKSSLYMYVQGAASKILLVWPDEIMEITESIDRSTEMVLIDATMLGVLLLRNNTCGKRELLNLVKASLALNDVCAADIVRDITPSDEKDDQAVGFFDCQRWVASLAKVQWATKAPASPKKSKKPGKNLLRRIFTRHKTL